MAFRKESTHPLNKIVSIEMKQLITVYFEVNYERITLDQLNFNLSHNELYKYAHVSNAFQACELVRVLFPARVSGEF